MVIILITLIIHNPYPPLKIRSLFIKGITLGNAKNSISISRVGRQRQGGTVHSTPTSLQPLYHFITASYRVTATTQLFQQSLSVASGRSVAEACVVHEGETVGCRESRSQIAGQIISPHRSCANALLCGKTCVLVGNGNAGGGIKPETNLHG